MGRSTGVPPANGSHRRDACATGTTPVRRRRTMLWQHLRLAGYVVLAVVCLPIAACLFCLLLALLVCLVVLITVCAGLAALAFALRDAAVRSWNNLPRNRRAIERARLALATSLPGREARNWHVARRDRHKCFVRA